MKIKEIIVVEGKEDTRRLKEIYKDIETIETRGSALSDRTIELIKAAQVKRGVIIFTDPDYQGNRIRKIINEKVPGCLNAYIKREKAIDERKHKIGVEHCTTEDIIESLSNITHIEDQITDVSYSDLYDLGLIGSDNCQELREYISEKLHLGFNNAKQFYNKIKMFNISLATLKKTIEDYERGETNE